MSVLGKSTTPLCETRIRVLLISTHPPVILHCAGKGGFAGVGAGLSSLLHRPGLASKDAYWMKPVNSIPVGFPPRSGTIGGGGGIAAGAGHGIGLRLWADPDTPSVATISSSSTTRATLKLFISCSNPLIFGTPSLDRLLPLWVYVLRLSQITLCAYLGDRGNEPRPSPLPSFPDGGGIEGGFCEPPPPPLFPPPLFPPPLFPPPLLAAVPPVAPPPPPAGGGGGTGAGGFRRVPRHV